jgi:sugar transferase (PEP-CTERM/EpsH1 system associated)
MRILYIAPRPPYPPEGRETVRPYHQIRFLALKHDVDLICFSGGGVDEWAARERLKKLCPRVQIIPIDSRPQDPSRVTNLLHRRPLALRRYYRRDLFRRLRGIGEAGRYDLVFVYSAAMAPYLSAFPNTPRVLDLVEVGSLRWLEVANLVRFPMSAVHRAEATRLLGVESRAAAMASRILLASESEAEAFRGMVPDNQRIAALKTPVNPRAPLAGPRASEPTILLSGHLDHYPNADSAVRFLCEVFPRIRERIPAARVVIAGKNPPAEIRLLAERPEVRIASPRADLRLLFREAWVVAAPHRVGHGVRNEILEAMAAGAPVVASREAASGLDLLAGRDVIVESTAPAMADRIVELLSDPAALDRLGARGRKAVQNNYSHWSVALRLEEILSGMSAEPAATR